MIATILKKDLQSNIQDAKIQALAIVVLCLTIVVTLLGIFEYRIKNERCLTEQAANLEQLYKNKVYATLHPKAIKMPTPLAVISKGVEANFGNSYTFDMLNVPYQADKIYEANVYIESFVNLDLSVIFIWFFSLISILIAYDSIVKEREDGTLKLMFVSKLSKFDFYMSKILTSTLSVTFVLFVAIFAIAAIFLFTPWITFDLQTGYALFLFFVLTLFYSIFWIAVATLCSIIFKSSAQSLVASLAVWILFLTVIPTAVKTVIGNTDFVNEKREIVMVQDDIMKNYYDRADELWDRDFAPLIAGLQFETYGGGINSEPLWMANPATRDAAINYYNTLNPLKNDFADRKYAVAEAGYLLPLKKSLRLLNGLANISPVTLFEKTGMQIAGTSYEDQFVFLDRFRTYRDQVIDFLMKRDAFSSKRWFTPDDPYSPDHPLCPKDISRPTREELDLMSDYYSQRDSEKWRLDLNDFPVFKASPADLKAKNNILPGLLVMMLLSCAVFALGLYRMNRYNNY
jgi:ABC-type transport system involved in multi-copper enzyme maturation permease subunit